MTGVYGKLPSHGDFVRRDLPPSFVQPWDTWLQAAMADLRESLGSGFDASWAAALPWRFRLPAGVCGETEVAGVLLPSRDSVGRPYPLALAALMPQGASAPNEAWYAALEHAGQIGRDQGLAVDAFVATLPTLAMARSLPSGGDIPGAGWWSADGRRWAVAAVPSGEQFRTLWVTGGPSAQRLMSRAASHRGTVRSRNEDSFVDRGDIGLWAVADGAGGHGAGDVASAAATAALAVMPGGLSAAEMLAQVRLRLADVHTELQRRAAAGASPSGVVATTVVVLMARDDHFACLWAGDSRAYLLRDGALCQMTRDHSLVQELVEAGALTPEQAEDHPQANVITRAVGSQEGLLLDKVAGRMVTGDRILLCTDGLFKALREDEIAQLLCAGRGPDSLIERALQAGARDNVTALLVEVGS